MRDIKKEISDFITWRLPDGFKVINVDFFDAKRRCEITVNSHDAERVLAIQLDHSFSLYEHDEECSMASVFESLGMAITGTRHAETVQ